MTVTLHNIDGTELRDVLARAKRSSAQFSQLLGFLNEHEAELPLSLRVELALLLRSFNEAEHGDG